MCKRIMTVADIKTELNNMYSNSRKESYQSRLNKYKLGKRFIEFHMESYNDYDELVKYLIDILNI